MNMEYKAVGMGILSVLFLCLLGGLSGSVGEGDTLNQSETAPAYQANDSLRQPGGAETQDDLFNQKFDDNPIDSDYQQEAGTNTQQMLLTSQKYTQIWESEASYAYHQLYQMSSEVRKKELAQEQEQWRDSLTDQIQEIKDKNAQAEGSVASLVISGEIMDLYRSRTEQLNWEIYRLTGTLNFHYRSDSQQESSAQ